MQLRPRKLADEVLALPPSERMARIAKIENVKLRAVVRFYVEDTLARRERKRLPSLRRIKIEEGDYDEPPF